MTPMNRFVLRTDPELDPEYVIQAFGEDAYALHPFSHGANYETAAAFLENGAGAVAWYHREIVSSASSFLTFHHEVELDVSTAEAHRRKGLAEACVSRMLRDCMQRGLTVHWDAQNESSRRLAEKFGFTVEQSYTVYVLV